MMHENSLENLTISDFLTIGTWNDHQINVNVLVKIDIDLHINGNFSMKDN